MNIEKTIEAVILTLKSGEVPFLHGPPGVGKNAVYREVCRRLQFNPWWPLVGDQLNVEDLISIPFADRDTKEMVLTRPWTFPPEVIPAGMTIRVDGETIKLNPDRPILIFVDELSDASVNMAKQLRQYIQVGQVKTHTLGDNVFIMAAGNRPEDKSGSRPLASSFITRVVHLGVCCEVPDFRPYLVESATMDVTSWIDWANKNGIRPEIIAHVKLHPDQLYSYQAVPRTWEKVSNILYVADVDPAYSPTDYIISEVIKGTVGPGPGTDIISTIKMFGTIPDPAVVLKSPLTAPVPKDHGILYALTSAMVQLVDMSNIDSLIAYADRLAKNSGAEYAAYMIMAATQKDNALKSAPSYLTWHNKNQDIMGGAI